MKFGFSENAKDRGITPEQVVELLLMMQAEGIRLIAHNKDFDRIMEVKDLVDLYQYIKKYRLEEESA